MGSVDRIIRATLTIVIVILYIGRQLTGTAVIFLLMVSAVYPITNTPFGTLSGYTPFKISIKKAK